MKADTCLRFGSASLSAGVSADSDATSEMIDIQRCRLDDPTVILDLLSELVNRYRMSDRVITYCNAAWAEQYGIDRDAVIGRRLDEFLSADELEGMHSQLALLGPARPVIVDKVSRAVPGASKKWVEWVDRYVLTENGPEVLSVGRDVTDRHLAELRLQESEARFRSLADHASDIVWRIRMEPSVHFEYMSPSVEHILGYPASHFLEDFERILDVADDGTRDLILQLLRDGRTRRRFDLRLQHADGSIVIGETTTTIDHDSVQGVMREVTELRNLQAAISSQAMRDPLTGISNRRRFDQLLHSELDRTGEAGTALAVAYVDLDGLKEINDYFGHDAGDLVLQETARRLCHVGAESGMVSRLGGDEFAIIFEPARLEPEDLVDQIDLAMAPPIVVSDILTLRCAASVGVAETSLVGRRAADLVGAADRAMYSVKRRRSARRRG